jgi:glycosyltransferase involved in cell wall biosynthesis
MVSALEPSKRVEQGIEAVSRISGAHLLVAGDGPLRRKVDVMAEKLLPNRFTRLSVAPQNMPAIYRSADVFLHLAKEEAFGNVFIEAMACGLPIVAPNSSRLRWIVGENEFLLDDDNPAAVASRIEVAAGASLVQRQERVSTAAAFSWVRIAARYREFLQEVVVSSGRRV